MKSKILKLIFALSFIPYLFILFYILFGKYILNGVELYGIQRLWNILKDIFEEFIFITPILPACLTFQMCYIFKNRTKIMFLCSFIPCLFVLLLGMYGAFFGARFFGETLSYGLDGFFIGIFFAFYYYIFNFPIIPICLVFQISCIIIKLKNKKTNLKEKSVY